MSSVISASAMDELASAFSGQIVREGDEGYDEARKVWNGHFDRRPGLVARCRSVAGVQAAVNFDRENGLTVAVRSGGHSAQGYGTWGDALVIDLALMKDIDVDLEARTVRAQAGLTWGEFDGARIGRHGWPVLDHRGRRADPWERQRLARAALRSTTCSRTRS